MHKLILSVSLLVAPWLVPGVPAQETEALVARIEKALAEKEPRWKVVPRSPQSDGHTIHLKSGRSHSLIWVHVGESARSAGEAFEGNTISFGNTAGRRGKKTRLPDFADENLMWPAFDGAGTTSIHFRQGNVYINLIAPSRATAERFARLALGQVLEQHQAPAARTGKQP